MKRTFLPNKFVCDCGKAQWMPGGLTCNLEVWAGPKPIVKCKFCKERLIYVEERWNAVQNYNLGSGVEIMSCEHKRISSMTWPDNSVSDLCRDCLLTRSCDEYGDNTWQDHNYKSAADWYKEAMEFQIEMDKI